MIYKPPILGDDEVFMRELIESVKYERELRKKSKKFGKLLSKEMNKQFKQDLKNGKVLLNCI